MSKFNNFIRKKAIKKLGEMFKELKDTENNEEFIEETSGYFSSREVYLETVKLIDQDLLKIYLEKVKTRAENKRVFLNADQVFEKLGIPEKMKEIMPISNKQKIELYSLCVKWVCCVEKNTDLVTRCITYDLVNRDSFSNYEQLIKEVNCPSRSLVLIGKSKFAQYCFNFVIDRIYSKALNRLTSGLRKMVISFMIYSVFGALSLSMVGMLSSVIDIPYLSDFAPSSRLTRKVMDLSLRIIMKITNLNTEEICPYLIRESITIMEEMNRKIETIIEQLLKLELSPEDFGTYQKELEK